MKIKNVTRDFDEISKLEPPKHKNPRKPSLLLAAVIKLVSIFDMIARRVKCKKIGMEKLGKNEPALILMNHSSFIDFELAFTYLFPRRFNIVATYDAFVGKKLLLEWLGCIPTRKFTTDLRLIKDIAYCIKTLKTSVLMYPEASYSFDGTATPLPSSLSKFVKMLGVPVIMLETKGAYHRDPLYNNLQNRKVDVSLEMRYVLSPEQTKELSAEEIQAILDKEFSFDNWRWQQENKVVVDEPFRADGLERVLYKCPHCQAEGKTEGKGTLVTCHSCGKVWELTELGFMKAKDGETEIDHVPDWFKWERECVKKEILDGTYGYKDIPVDIYVLINTDGVFKVGEGLLSHDFEGIHLTGCDGRIDYRQKSISMYSIYSDYYWYTLGDIISFGTNKITYYCMPQNKEDLSKVAKTRLAVEEIYKILKAPKTEE